MKAKESDVLLDHIDVVKLEISIWTSSKKLRKEDLVLADGSVLPPEDLAHLGTKKTIDPERLNVFNRIKKEAERVCLQHGTRFLGGFANPKATIPGIVSQLNALSKEFYRERDAFLDAYETETEDWSNRHPEFRDAIRRAIEPVASVAAKIRFDYVIFHVTQPEVSVSRPTNENSLERKALGLGDQLFSETATDATEILERSFVGRSNVTARVLPGFKRIRNKLNSLGFLDHRTMPVVDEIDRVLESVPLNGPYEGAPFNELFRLAMLLSDPEKIKRHGSGLLSESESTVEEYDARDLFPVSQFSPSNPEPAVDTAEGDKLDPELDTFFSSYDTLYDALDDARDDEGDIGNNGDGNEQVTATPTESHSLFDDEVEEKPASVDESEDGKGTTDAYLPKSASATFAADLWF